MAIPTRLMGVGLSGGAATNICGDVASGLTAAGTSNADALRLTAAINEIGTTGTGTGVALPPIEVGAAVLVHNAGANALLVYPGTTGAQINALTATTGGFSVAAGGRALFTAVSGTRWSALLSA